MQNMDKLIEDSLKCAVQMLGYDSIRPEQKDILTKLLSGMDCLYVAPTGSGKSFIFEALPFATSYINNKKQNNKLDTLVLVISPLVSLMQMQARDLNSRGIKAAYLQVNIC